MRLGSFQLPNDASLSYAEYGTSTASRYSCFTAWWEAYVQREWRGLFADLPMRVIALARPGLSETPTTSILDCVADWGRLAD